MRTLFLLLALANLAFFGYHYYIAPRTGGQASVSGVPLNAERVRVLSQTEFARLAAARRGASCIELGPIAPGDAARAEEAVAALAAGAKVAARRSDESTRWWVYIPPLPTRQAAVQREAELKKQGVEDSSVIAEESNFRHAISLGVFRSEEAANSRAEALRKRGVEGVAVAPRDGAGARTYVQLREAPEAVRMKLIGLRERFPGAEVRECQGG
jgi:hypothetical protein